MIDEEHDPSYKQEGDPCYDARTVARKRAEDCGAVLVAGTATPRPESWLELPRIELPSRVDGRGMPPVEVLDMREADPRSGPLHPATWEALDGVRAAGAKAIVMANRRGFAPWLTCRSCGRHWGCPNCDVSLIVHRHAGRIVCHHCAHSEPLPRACPDCDSTTLSRAGAGTEQIEALLAERLAPLPVFRLDSDTAGERGAHARILAEFDRAESAVLVGTQMVAKGHDFPEVTLSAILDADATLRFPDFRAGERTFAMVAQLAGRSGRGAAGGEVIVQTLAPRRRASPTPPPTTRPASSPRRSSAAGRSATRPSRTSSASCSRPRPSRASTPPRRSSPRRCARPCPRRPTCSARRRCSASATATAAAS